ncbi:hypothetical protein BS17DRAFT_512953 [Gyrodon lividus]|nr:hypothetical protein BS17DRAFT_512953 [Gyrodon lividus]
MPHQMFPPPGSRLRDVYTARAATASPTEVKRLPQKTTESQRMRVQAPPLSSSSASRSVSDSSSESCPGVGCARKNPITSLRCRLWRRLLCRRMLMDRREMSCVVSPAKVVKKFRKWMHMSKTDSTAFARDDVQHWIACVCRGVKEKQPNIRTVGCWKHLYSGVSRLRWY